jgi:hypothetical protein
MTPPKVLYIAGWGRSGSTLLNEVLGQIDGWFASGELSFLWYDEYCRCGATAFACDVWGPVLSETFDRHPDLEPASLVAIEEQWFDRNPAHLAAIARESKRHAAGNRHPLRRYAEVLADVYASAARAGGARVLVDSSKGAPIAYLIATLTEIDLYLVHLVRDPRACAYSFAKTKLKPGEPLRYYNRRRPATSSLHWLRRNAIIEALLRRRLGDRYLRVRYEDFAESPRQTVGAICSLLGEPDAVLPFHDEHLVRFSPTHTIAGNPPRSSRGELRIRPDDEWRVQMDRRAQRLAMLAAAPLMPRYRYSLRSTGSR